MVRHAPPAIAAMPGLRDITRLGPKLTGIYFLCDDDGSIVYVGQSVNVLSRVRQHVDTERAFKRAFYAPCLVRDLDALERALLRHFKPDQNGPRTHRGEADYGVLGAHGVRAPEIVAWQKLASARWLDSLQVEGGA